MRSLLLQATCFGILYVLLLGWGVGFSIIHSWDWPLFHDGVILHYMAWRFLNGAIPYVDIFDQEMPGAYMLHMACLVWLGPGDLAFRMFDLLFCLLAGSGIVALSWRQSPLYGCAGALLFALIHLSNGVISMAQRDFLAVPFLLFALLALRATLEQKQRMRYAGLCGLLAGCACWIKPVCALFLLLCVIAVYAQKFPMRQRVSAVISMAAGTLIPTILLLGWLYQSGALFAFYDTFLHFTLPVYGQITFFHANAVFFIFLTARFGGVFLLLMLLYTRTTIRTADKTILLIGLLYGLIHFYLQRIGFPYHGYPLWAGIALYFALVLPRLQFKKPAEYTLIYSLALLCCLLLLPSPDPSQTILSPATRGKIDAYLSTVTHDADAALRTIPADMHTAYDAQYPHQAVQFFDMAGAELWNAAYRQQWLAPTRHISSYPFFYGGIWEKPTIKVMQAELLAELLQKKPLVIILSSETFPNVDGKLYHDVDTLPPWKDFFAQHYRLTKQTALYRVYARSN